MFQPYDVMYHEDALNKELRMWCLNEQSDPVLFRVIDVNMYTTHMLPENINWAVQSLSKALINSVSYRLRSKEIDHTSVNICVTKKLCYHDPRKANGSIPDKSFVIIVRTTTMQYLQRIENLLKYPTTITYKKSSVKVHMSKCNPRIGLDWRILCGLGTSGISYCGWFKTDVVYTSDSPISKVPEYVVYPKNIIPIDSNKTTTPIVMSFDIECFSDNPKAFPKEYKPKDVAYLITTSTKRVGTDEKTRRVAILMGDCDNDLALSGSDDRELENSTGTENKESDSTLRGTIIKVSTETELIRAFEEVIRRENPILITGYNTVGFDWKYLDGRMSLHLIEWGNFSLMKTFDVIMSTISWGSGAYGDVNLFFPKCPGRIFVDVMSHVKRTYKLPRFTLNHVAEEFLGKKKLDVSAKEMFAAFRAQRDGEHDHIKKMSRVVKYGILDADLPIELFEHFKMWVATIEMCNVVNVTPNMILKSGQQKRVAALLYKECMQQGITMNYQVIGARGYTGGYVGRPIKGMHDNVIVLDFASLYPSIMFMWNLCYSTYVLPEFVQYIRPEHKQYYHFITIQKLKEEIKDEDETDLEEQTETHVFFRGKMGVIPLIVSKLLAARKDVKNQMKQHPKGSEEYDILDARQLAYKVSCNSIYGFLGVSEEKGILPLLPIAKTVTFLGRDAILKTNRYITETWPGTQIVYNDTDSTMFTVDCSVVGAPRFNSYEEFGEMVGNEISRYLKLTYLGEEEMNRRDGQLGMLDLEFEELVKKMFCIEKKMYVKAYPCKDDPDKIDFDTMKYKGIMLARRNACNFTRNVYRSVLMKIMNGESSDDVAAEMVRYMILCRSRSIKMVDLLENQGVGGSYKNKTFFTSMFVDNLALDGKNVKSGERLDYIVLESVDNKTIVRENGKKYKGDKMRLMEQINDMLSEGSSFKLDTDYYSNAGIDNIDKLFSIAYYGEIQRRTEAAEKRCLKLHEGDPTRIRILKEAGYPDFRVRNSSYFTRINSAPLKNFNKLAKLKSKWVNEIEKFDRSTLRRTTGYIKYCVTVLAA